LEKINDMRLKKNHISCDVTLKEDLLLMRYMDLPKFIDMIRTGKLYLTSAVDFNDQLEGTLPESIRDSFLNDPEVVAAYGNLPIQEREYLNKIRTNISCWTKGTADNMALWKIYGGSKQSVAVMTTLNKIVQSAISWKNISSVALKDVIYIDHSGILPDGVYSLSPETFGLKHEAYSFENEVRIVITRDNNKTPSPMRLPIAINSFIEKIIVAPEAGAWFFDMVKDLSEKYGITAPVENSKLTRLVNHRDKINRKGV